MADPVTPTDVGAVETIEDLRNVVNSGGAPLVKTISVKGYWAAGDGGGGMFRFDSATTGVNDGTIIEWKKGTGRWLRIIEGGRNYDFRWFGAKGDGVNNDTEECQATIDAAMAAGVGLEFSCGDYLVGPLYGNGTKWKNGNLEHDPPIPPMSQNCEQPSVLSFRGQGRSPFLCRLIAGAGAYSARQAILTFRNIAGKTISNFQIDAAGVAESCADFDWRGGSTPTDSAAPSNHNEFTHLWGSGATKVGWRMRQCADSKISSISYRGGTAPYAMDLRIGGGMWGDNLFFNDGKLLISCQNAGFQNCGFFKGVEVSVGFNNIHFDSCHFYPYTPVHSGLVNPLSTQTWTGNNDWVQVACPNHGLAVGNRVVIPDTVTDIGGLLTGQMSGVRRVMGVSDDGNRYWFKADASATSEVNGGGGTLTITGRGFTVHSSAIAGLGAEALTFTSCWFNSLGVTGQQFFGGRWQQGARFYGCRFGMDLTTLPPAPPRPLRRLLPIPLSTSTRRTGRPLQLAVRFLCSFSTTAISQGHGLRRSQARCWSASMATSIPLASASRGSSTREMCD